MQERIPVARGTNTVIMLPHDAAAVRQFLQPLMERIEGEEGGDAPLGLVLAPDAEAVMRIARTAAELHGGEVPVLPVTSAQRAARALRAGAPAVIIATPGDLLELVRGSIVKLHAVRAVVFAWAEALLDGAEDVLATLIAELPRDAARTLVATRVTPQVESFAERYVRRIAKGGPAPATAPALDVPLRTVTTADAAKPAMLRRVLDALDPVAATIFVRSGSAARTVEEELRALGQAAAAVTIVREGAGEGELLVLYELPESAAELRAVAGGGATRIVALVQPREMSHLAEIAGATRVEPLVLPGPADRARAREERVRDEIRSVVREGLASRELLALEPLLEEFDAVEVAAAALRLLEATRESARAARAPRESAPAAEGAARQPRPPREGRDSREPASASSAAPSGPTSRIFFAVGARDGAQPGDFVGTLVHSADVPSAQIGKIEVRDSHTLVEVPAGRAGAIVDALASVTIRGRRAGARLDRERAASGDRAPRGDRPPRGGAPRARQAERGRGPADRPRGRSRD